MLLPAQVSLTKHCIAWNAMQAMKRAPRRKSRDSSSGTPTTTRRRRTAHLSSPSGSQTVPDTHPGQGATAASGLAQAHLGPHSRSHQHMAPGRTLQAHASQRPGPWARSAPDLRAQLHAHSPHPMHAQGSSGGPGTSRVEWPQGQERLQSQQAVPHHHGRGMRGPFEDQQMPMRSDHQGHGYWPPEPCLADDLPMPDELDLDFQLPSDLGPAELPSLHGPAASHMWQDEQCTIPRAMPGRQTHLQMQQERCSEAPAADMGWQMQGGGSYYSSQQPMRQDHPLQGSHPGQHQGRRPPGSGPRPVLARHMPQHLSQAHHFRGAQNPAGFTYMMQAGEGDVGRLGPPRQQQQRQSMQHGDLPGCWGPDSAHVQQGPLEGLPWQQMPDDRGGAARQWAQRDAARSSQAQCYGQNDGSQYLRQEMGGRSGRARHGGILGSIIREAQESSYKPSPVFRYEELRPQIVQVLSSWPRMALCRKSRCMTGTP